MTYTNVSDTYTDDGTDGQRTHDDGTDSGRTTTTTTVQTTDGDDEHDDGTNETGRTGDILSY